VTRPFDAVSWMWDEALTAFERAERRHRRFFALLSVRGPLPAWEPPADVFETDEEVWIVVALPGVRAEQVALSVGPTELLVQTQREPPPTLEFMRIRRMEIPYGTFERRIELPPGRYTLLEQRMVDGCLELRLTKE
jgi:HSP20 family protein